MCKISLTKPWGNRPVSSLFVAVLQEGGWVGGEPWRQEGRHCTASAAGRALREAAFEIQSGDNWKPRGVTVRTWETAFPEGLLGRARE